MLRERRATPRDLVSARAFVLIWAPIAAISAVHYAASADLAWLHDVLRRLYYLPIILGAFAYGLRGSLGAAALATALYTPHAFLHVHHQDPADTLEKVLEILLYFVFAGVSGVLANREFAERAKQQAAAEQLRRTLAEKDQMEKMLLRSERLKSLGELTAGLAHEIKNPLASIRGSAETVAEEIAPDSPKRRMADVLLREIGRLETTLDRFLNFARPREYSVAPVSVGRQLVEVKELMAAQARQRGVEIVVTPPGEDVAALTDKDQLRQVLVNLILNAVQAMPAGGEVRLSCARSDRLRRPMARIVVEDSGPGIPETLLEKIFDPFVSGKEGSLGLGLAITARILDQHQGFIEAANRAGGGARFAVFLPAAPCP
jgi:signal transduction histidine kinase